MIDFCLNKEIAQISNNIDCVLQQLEIFMDTYKDELLGETCGNDFDKFLFDTSAGNHYTTEYIESSIKGNVDLLGWELEVGIDFMMGTQNDILIIYLTLYNQSGDSYTKAYKMTEGSIDPVY